MHARNQSTVRLILVIMTALLLATACGSSSGSDATSVTDDSDDPAAAAYSSDGEPTAYSATPDATDSQETYSGLESATPTNGGPAATVVLDDFSITFAGVVISGPVTFNVQNTDDIVHEFIVVQADGYAGLPQAADGSVLLDELSPDALIARTQARLAPGGFEQVPAELVPGNYVFFCNVVEGGVSHVSQGMVADLTVT